jgi:hypothetical protein
MARFLWLVMTNPAEGREQEFNRWYDEEHVPDMLGVATVVAVQRFEFVTGGGSAEPGLRYLAVYEVEADSPEQTMAAMDKARAEPGRMRASSSLDRDARLWFFRPLGPRIGPDNRPAQP